MSRRDTGGFEARLRRKTLAPVNQHYSDVGEAGQCRIAVFEYVLIQPDNLLTHADFAERVAAGSLRLFGWIACHDGISHAAKQTLKTPDATGPAG